MKWSIVVGLFLLIIGFCLVTAGPSRAQSPTAVSISPSSQTVGSSQSFNVDVYVTPDEAIAGVQFDLSFDATLLQANSVTEGNLLNQGGCSTFFQPGTINNAAGKITGVAGAVTTPGCAISNPGAFVNINFTSRTVSGTSPISMFNVVVGDINGLAISTSLTNGSFTVAAPGITITPTPISTATATPAPTPTPISTATATPAPTPTPISIATATTAPTYTPISTATATTAPTPTPISTATATPIITPTPIGTVTATPTPALTSISDSASELIFRIGLENGITDGSGVLLQDIDVRSYDGTTTAKISAGTQITAPSGQPVDEITMKAATTIPPVPEGYLLIQAFDFGPDGTVFSSALQITLEYDLSQLPLGQDPVVAYYVEATGEWVFLICDVDTVTGTITFSIAHFSTYALMGHSATPVVHEGIALWVWIVIGIVVVLALIVIIRLVLQRYTAASDTSQSNS